MDVGDVVKYTPTSTVGKVVDIKEMNGKVWMRLDRTDLYYVADTLVAADVSEYKTSSFKERESKEFKGRDSVDDLQKMEREVDITEMMPSGGG
ncbi:MAG: DUF2098 domain-containing protein [archaeon]|nr:DUF2098 domain-containing protein [archaeon]